MASNNRQLSAELNVDRLEATIAAAVSEWTEAQCDAHVHGRAMPPAPAVVRSQQTRRELAQWAESSLRARQLQLLCERANAAAQNGPHDVATALRLDGASRALYDWARHYDGDPVVAAPSPDRALRARIGQRLRLRSAVTEGQTRLAAAGIDLAAVRFAEPHAGATRRPHTYLISPPDRVAVVANAPPTLAGWRQVWHELGHAAFALSHDPKLPWSLRDAPSPVVHEAFAELFASRIDDADVIATLLEVDDDTAASIAAWRAYRRQLWRQQLLAPQAPAANARYVIADALARVLRAHTGPSAEAMATVIRAAAWQGAGWQWHELAGQ